MSLMVTPQEQLRRLVDIAVRESVDTSQETLGQRPDDVVQIIQSATQCILKPIVSNGSEDSFPRLADLAADKVVKRHPLLAPLTHWYTALKLLDALPDTIPALPSNIDEILNGKCPIYKGLRKPDGTSYKVSDTHSLYLIPSGTLQELESRVKAYGEQTLHANPNPLQFRYFWDAAYQEHADVRFEEHQWILISNDVLSESRNQSYQQQTQLVANLSAKSLLHYEVPSLREAVGAIFLHKVATGESLYQEGNEQNNGLYTYTRVPEITLGYHLIVGGFAPFGVAVCSFGNAAECVGVAALRKF